MKSVDFPQANLPLAKDQPQYQTLFVRFEPQTYGSPMRACFELSDEEIEEIVKTKRLWFQQLTFGNGFSPIHMSFQSPFPEIVNPFFNIEPMDENRTPADLWNSTHYKDDKAIDVVSARISIETVCANCGKKEEEHYWSSRQCKL